MSKAHISVGAGDVTKLSLCWSFIRADTGSIQYNTVSTVLLYRSQSILCPCIQPRMHSTGANAYFYIPRLTSWRWRFGVAVTRWSRSTQLLYIEPG